MALFGDCSNPIILENQVNSHASVKDSLHWKEIQNFPSLTSHIVLDTIIGCSIIEHVW